MNCRVAHPLRLIAFDVGDTPRHCIGDLKDNTLLSGVFCAVCKLAVVERWLGQLENSRVASESPGGFQSSGGFAQRNVKIILN